MPWLLSLQLKLGFNSHLQMASVLTTAMQTSNLPPCFHGLQGPLVSGCQLPPQAHLPRLLSLRKHELANLLWACQAGFWLGVAAFALPRVPAYRPFPSPSPSAVDPTWILALRTDWPLLTTAALVTFDLPIILFSSRFFFFRIWNYMTKISLIN